MKKIGEDIQRMIDNEGLWIVVDDTTPGAYVPIMSMGGKLFAIKLDQELAPDRFFPTARVASGPHRANESSSAMAATKRPD